MDRIDGFACEPQFLAHAAPVWRAMHPSIRGAFHVPIALAGQARLAGVEPEIIDANAIRSWSEPPLARIEPGPLAFVVSIGDTKVARRLGYRRFAFMEHGAGQAYPAIDHINARNPSYSGGLDREDTELFLVPNDYSAGLWRTAYPDAVVEVVGSPRLDYLPRRAAGPGPVVAISFHWPAKTCDESDTALGTYIDVLPALAAAYPGHIIGHAHPKADWSDRMTRTFRNAGIPFVPDFDDVCRLADVYAVDNSSTLWEFASTGRPVVVLNGDRYHRDRNHGLRFEPSDGCGLRSGRHYCGASHVGIQVDRPEDLLAAVEEAIADPAPRRTAREAALRLVYPGGPGAAERAAAALSRWAGAEMAVAA